ncbi:DUF4145 domain-containing protein [Helicobacter sp. 13S00482-2]|uniref:DUF4145 domain-containing protein n=1 Tax=Helicobacter sp. 13S00482-2 TaxID=1476200 RepID=UPI001C5E4231|nr:DUF4145 domain-containing protein [Helicobacter sp. 13S00482-2]
MKSNFICPRCNVHAQMEWRKFVTIFFAEIDRATCWVCEKPSIWYSKKMVYPEPILVDSPNKDLPEDIKEIYKETALIVNYSPRGACALLRLALQKLTQHLGQGDKNLNDVIAELVKQGLPSKVQKALDIVRVVGNNAVHSK